MTKLLTGATLVCGAVLALSTPAFAKEPTAVAGTSAPSQDAPAANANTRYCFNTEGTGSRMTKKVCHTRAEWLTEGVDPLNPNQQQ